MNNTQTATVRTTVNGTVGTLIVMLANKFFGWELTLEDLLPWTPVLAVVIAIGYRLSLVLTELWPPLGYVLFGTKAEPPTYLPPS